MNTEILDEDVNDAALIGAIELMTSPDYGADWLKELGSLIVGDENSTEEFADRVDKLMSEKLTDLARALFDQLREPYRETYADRFANPS